MTERRWRVSTGPGRGLFLIEVDDGQGFRPATAAEVDSALRQRELFGAADYPARNLGHDDGLGGRSSEPAHSPAGRAGRTRRRIRVVLDEMPDEDEPRRGAHVDALGRHPRGGLLGCVRHPLPLRRHRRDARRRSRPGQRRRRRDDGLTWTWRGGGPPGRQAGFGGTAPPRCLPVPPAKITGSSTRPAASAPTPG